MKNVIIAISILLITGCAAKLNTTPNNNTVDNTTQSQRTADGHLYGIQQKQDFITEPFKSWFEPNYNNYKLDDDTKHMLKKHMKKVTIKAYMGTWCGDSKRETPKFYKLLDEINFNTNKLTLIAVDRSKKEPANLVDGHNIIRVPTFIFYRDGLEVGRYVERPRESLEKDILKIVSGQDYKHSYE